MAALNLTTDPEVQGGAMCFAGTRVPLSAVLAFYRRGWEPEEVQQEYPSLPLDALVMAFELYWDFCRGAPPEGETRDDLDVNLRKQAFDAARDLPLPPCFNKR